MHAARVCAVLVGSAAVPATSARAAVPPADATRDSERLAQLARNDSSLGHSERCHTTTTEIIAILLGFLLCTIPVVILLIVFC